MKDLLIIKVIIIIFLLLKCVDNKDETYLNDSKLRGAKIYKSKCMQCHGDIGVPSCNSFPPIAESDFLNKNIEASIMIIKNGSNSGITVNGEKYSETMPNRQLNNQQIADVVNYITNNWKNKPRAFSEKDIDNIVSKSK